MAESAHHFDHPKFGFHLGIIGLCGVGLALMAPSLFWVGASVCYICAVFTLMRYWPNRKLIWEKVKINENASELLVVCMALVLELIVPTYLIYIRISAQDNSSKPPPTAQEIAAAVAQVTPLKPRLYFEDFSSNVGQIKQPGAVKSILGPSLDRIRIVEIGNSGTSFLLNMPNSVPFLKFADNSSLLIDSVGDELKVSTQVRDQTGKLVAELIQNEWKIAPPLGTWDRNYNDNAVEVRADNGRIVLQVQLLSDRVQIQGEWWSGPSSGLKLVANPRPEGGALMYIFGPARSAEGAVPIEPIFRYPSATHLSELLPISQRAEPPPTLTPPQPPAGTSPQTSP